MPNYFPGKKVFGVAAIAVVLLIVVVVTRDTTPQPTETLSDTILRTVAMAGSPFSDIDKDGLPDWEEDILGTDPEDPDENKNGILDGDELNARESLSNLVESDSVMNALRTLQENGPDAFDPTSNFTTKPPVYDEPYAPIHLRLVEATNTARNTYLDEILGIIAGHTLIADEKPLELIEQWLESFNDDDIDDIERIAQELKTLAEYAMELNVPRDLETLHLELSNNLYLSGRSLEDIRQSIDDPILGFFASANYVNHESKFRRTISVLSRYYETYEE